MEIHVSNSFVEAEVAIEMEAEECEQGKQHADLRVSVVRKQNRMDLENLARSYDRFNISNRAGAAIASAALKDAGIITDDYCTYAIDKNNRKQQREKYR